MQVTASNTPSPSQLTVVQNEKSIILSPNYTTEAKITITDAYGETIFSDIVESDKKRIKYDLKALSTAQYTIRVYDKQVINVYKTQVYNDKIELVKTKSYYRPTIKNLDGKVVVKAELENKEDIHISIYDEANTLVFQHNIEKEDSFVQSLNLNQLPKGQYKVQVSSEYFVERMNVTL